jgi:hypothetical protein
LEKRCQGVKAVLRSTYGAREIRPDDGKRKTLCDRGTSDLKLATTAVEYTTEVRGIYAGDDDFMSGLRGAVAVETEKTRLITY